MNFLGKLLALGVMANCVAISFVSSAQLGPGLWSWVILISGFCIGVGAFMRWSASLTKVICAFLGLISFGAFFLGMLAGTIGSGLDQDAKLLLMLFLLAAILCVVLLISQRGVRQPANNSTT